MARALAADAAVAAQIDQQFEGDFKLRFHLAPPLFAQRDPETGRLMKQEFGGWMLHAFRVLAQLKFLRGTAFDPFGYTAERKEERALIGQYESLVDELLAGLSPQNLDLAVKLASIPDDIRGYGHVKDAHLRKAKAKEAERKAAAKQREAERKAAEKARLEKAKAAEKARIEKAKAAEKIRAAKAAEKARRAAEQHLAAIAVSDRVDEQEQCEEHQHVRLDRRDRPDRPGEVRLISPQGQPVWRVEGAVDWSGQESGGWIRRLLDTPPLKPTNSATPGRPRS